VAERLGRRWIGIELSAEYARLARRRTAQAGLPSKRSSDAPAKR
jgi:DNA modification methylase